MQPVQIQNKVNTKKAEVNVDARPSKRKQEPTNEELKLAKAAESKVKKLKTSERDAASASYVELLDNMHESKRDMDMVDKTHDMVETLLNCKYCLRKSYKRLESTACSLEPSCKTTVERKMLDSSFVEHHQSGHATEKASLNDKVSALPVLVQPGPVQLEKGVESPSCSYDLTENVSEADSDLVYVGDSKYGIRASKQAVDRCLKTAKTPEKLALNLVEVVLSEEDIRTCTMYVNTQHNKKAIDEKKRRAMRTHISGIFGDADWEKLTKIMNDKIRKMKKKNINSK